MFYYVIDDELRLELLELKHVQPLYELVDTNRKHLRAWLPWVDETTRPEHTKAFVRQSLARFADNNGFDCAIVEQGRVVGCIGLHEVDWPHLKSSIGYWLSAERQGRGIMSRACTALVEHAFGKMRLNRLEIRAATGNYKSRAIPERLGFTLEGVIREAERVGESFLDHAVYGMLAREWNQGESTFMH